LRKHRSDDDACGESGDCEDCDLLGGFHEKKGKESERNKKCGNGNAERKGR
jgi:hypothetical protein